MDGSQKYIFNYSDVEERRKLRNWRLATALFTAAFVAQPYLFPAPPFFRFYALFSLIAFWLLALFGRLIVRKADRIWSMELFRDKVVVHRIWGDVQVSDYTDIAQVDVNYASFMCNYDSLDITLAFDDGRVLSTGRCRTRGEAVEEAARRIRERVLLLTGRTCGDTDNDRALRLAKRRKSAMMNILVIVPVLILYGLAVNGFMDDIVLDLRLRRHGKDTLATVSKIAADARGGFIGYQYQADGVEYQGGFHETSWRLWTAEVGMPVMVRYDSTEPAVSAYKDNLPLIRGETYAYAVAMTLILTVHVLLTGVAILWGRHLVVIRRRVHLLRRDELEEDRLEKGQLIEVF